MEFKGDVQNVAIYSLFSPTAVGTWLLRGNLISLFQDDIIHTGLQTHLWGGGRKKGSHADLCFSAQCQPTVIHPGQAGEVMRIRSPCLLDCGLWTRRLEQLYPKSQRGDMGL